MKNLVVKEGDVLTLKQKYGDDFFKRNVFALSSSIASELADMARKVKYRKPKNGYCSLGRSYFMHLQKIEYRLNK